MAIYSVKYLKHVSQKEILCIDKSFLLSVFAVAINNSNPNVRASVQCKCKFSNL